MVASVDFYNIFHFIKLLNASATVIFLFSSSYVLSILIFIFWLHRQTGVKWPPNFFSLQIITFM